VNLDLKRIYLLVMLGFDLGFEDGGEESRSFIVVVWEAEGLLEEGILVIIRMCSSSLLLSAFHHPPPKPDSVF